MILNNLHTCSLYYWEYQEIIEGVTEFSAKLWLNFVLTKIQELGNEGNKEEMNKWIFV